MYFFASGKSKQTNSSNSLSETPVPPVLCLDWKGGAAAVLRWNLALPDVCILLMAAPCPSAPCLHCPTIQHPGSAASCEAASEGRNVIQCNVVATDTAMIQCRDKPVLVLSVTLKAGQTMGSRKAAECGEKKRLCMYPWRQWKDSGKDSNDIQKLFYLGVLLLWIELLKCVLGQQGLSNRTFAGHCSHASCVNPLP